MPPTPPPGTLSGSETLDQPPPSPALSAGVNPGMPLVSQMGAPSIGANQIPPEMLTGMLQASTKIAEQLASFAQATPDLAPYWQAVQAALAEAMSRVLMAGGGPTSPTATGPGFPGGGFDRGDQPLASGGSL